MALACKYVIYGLSVSFDVYGFSTTVIREIFVVKGIVPHYKGWLLGNEATHAHTVNEHGAWWMAGKFTCVDSNWLSLSGVRHFKQHICSQAFTYQYSYSLVVHIIEDYQASLCNFEKSSRCTHYTGHAHTSCTHFSWISPKMTKISYTNIIYQ